MAHRVLGVAPHQHHRPHSWRSHRTSHISCAHRGGGWSSDRNCYEVLGVPRHATEDELKAAFRRKAKELHPDVNKEDGADEAFIEASQAYELLSDRHRRAEHDRMHPLRRINFFQDQNQEQDEYGDPIPSRWSAARPGDEVDDEDDDEGGSGWHAARRNGHQGSGWAREQAARGGGGSGGFGWGSFGGASGRRERRGRRGADEEEEEDGEGEGVEGEGGPPTNDELSEAQREALRLEQLMNLMSRFGPDGPLSRWQRGETEPWGTSTSDQWAERVRQQRTDPFGNRGMRGAGRDDMRGVEWAPPGRRRGPGGGDDAEGDDGGPRPGWVPPGRGNEWRPGGRPDLRDDEEGVAGVGVVGGVGAGDAGGGAMTGGSGASRCRGALSEVCLQ